MRVSECAGVLHTVKCCRVLGGNGLWRAILRKSAAKIEVFDVQPWRQQRKIGRVIKSQDVTARWMNVIPRITRLCRLMRPPWITNSGVVRIWIIQDLIAFAHAAAVHHGQKPVDLVSVACEKLQMPWGIVRRVIVVRDRVRRIRNDVGA